MGFHQTFCDFVRRIVGGGQIGLFNQSWFYFVGLDLEDTYGVDATSSRILRAPEYSLNPEIKETNTIMFIEVINGLQ